MDGILYHTTQITRGIITNMISKTIFVKTTTIISKSCMYYRGISISHNKIGRNTWYVKLWDYTFFEVGNGGESFK